MALVVIQCMDIISSSFKHPPLASVASQVVACLETAGPLRSSPVSVRLLATAIAGRGEDPVCQALRTSSINLRSNACHSVSMATEQAAALSPGHLDPVAPKVDQGPPAPPYRYAIRRRLADAVLAGASAADGGKLSRPHRRATPRALPRRFLLDAIVNLPRVEPRRQADRRLLPVAVGSLTARRRGQPGGCHGD